MAGTARLSQCNFTSTTSAAAGGAVYAAAVEMDACAVSGTSASLGGGAAFAITQLSATRSRFVFCRCYGCDGGALAAAEGASIAVGASSFHNCSASRGGAVRGGGAVNVTDSSFNFTAASGAGGAVMGQAEVVLADSTFQSSRAGGAGGAAQAATLVVARCQFSETSAGAEVCGRFTIGCRLSRFLSMSTRTGL